MSIYTSMLPARILCCPLNMSFISSCTGSLHLSVMLLLGSVSCHKVFRLILALYIYFLLTCADASIKNAQRFRKNMTFLICSLSLPYTFMVPITYAAQYSLNLGAPTIFILQFVLTRKQPAQTWKTEASCTAKLKSACKTRL